MPGFGLVKALPTCIGVIAVDGPNPKHIGYSNAPTRALISLTSQLFSYRRAPFHLRKFESTDISRSNCASNLTAIDITR